MVLNFSEEEIRVYLSRSARASLHSYGVEFKGLYYNNTELSLLRRHVEVDRRHANGGDLPHSQVEDGKLYFKYSPSDIGSIWVLDPIAGQYIRTEAVFAEYARGMTLRRHELNLQYARQFAKTFVDEAALLRAHDELTTIIRSTTVHDAERLGRAFARGVLVDSPEARPASSCPETPPLEGDPSRSQVSSSVQASTASGAWPCSEADADEIGALADLWSQNDIGSSR
ncbi:Mu transposase C-terminal domain-containing protein [Sinimarinibacterium flocculans]|uniref:Mu transposase C-terminal domain-containing protein n=1 Tax=Sinimarinibacterium flocculans TaxID=985250 RepID=UPI003518FD52